MASRVKLETHSITVKIKNQRDSGYLNLWNLDGKNLTFNKVFHDFLEWLDTATFANYASKKVFAFLSEQAQLSLTDEFQSGRFEYGEYGIANPIKNIQSREIVHPKAPDESEVFPLYFLMYIPSGENQGMFVFQRYGNVAMLTQFKMAFNDFIQERYPLYKVAIEPLTPIEILREYINKGTVEEIILKRRDLPTDDVNRIMAGGLDNKPTSIKVQISGPGILGRNKLHSWLDNHKANFVIQELSQLGLNGDHKTTVSINVNGTMREIDFSDTGKIRPYIDIHTEDLLDKETGHPIFEDINRIAKHHAKDIFKANNRQN